MQHRIRLRSVGFAGLILSLALVAVCGVGVDTALAHVEDRPSIHDQIADILARMRNELDLATLSALDVPTVEAFLSEKDREILGSQYLTFHVNTPVRVTVFRHTVLGDEPFWLAARDFTSTGEEVEVGGNTFDLWERDFDAGDVGLGMNALSGSGRHYFVGLTPLDPEAELEVEHIYPGQHNLGVLEEGAGAFADRHDTIETLPARLEGQTLLRSVNNRRREAQLLYVFHTTPHIATEKPDQQLLTWSDDPASTQTIQWRTSVNVADGAVAYMKKSEYHAFTQRTPQVVTADTALLETPFNINDPVVHRHTAVLRDLEPGTEYVYAVGSASEQDFTHLASFRTAPDGEAPFSFVYMGDVQNGLERWESLVQRAHRERPDAAFYVLAGDLVNRGNERHEWDRFFQSAHGVFDRKPLIPAAGNHEYQGGDPWLYLRMFTLPDNGPEGLERGKAYSFEYSNALFVVLDSNLPAETQTEWLEAQLTQTDATWKFVVYHHPAYSSSANRDNPDVRTLWGELFDKYHVDMALQGHDHAYLRTYPMKGGEAMDTPDEGTIYIVSVAGSKFYDQGDHDYTEVGFMNTPTFQVLDIQVQGDRLLYRAYDQDGKLKDELIIEK